MGRPVHGGLRTGKARYSGPGPVATRTASLGVPPGAEHLGIQHQAQDPGQILTAIGNVGPGLGVIGAYDNFAHFPGLVKIVLALCMLFGRLEIFTLLAMFSREFWKR